MEVRCEACGYRQRLTERLRVYRFPDRTTLPLQRDLAWCHRCLRVIEAEHLPELHELEQEIAEVRRTAEWAAEEVEGLERLCAWRRSRVSSPKCLECGSASVEVFPQDEDAGWRPITHPGCGGTLSVGGAGHALVREDFRYYAPEGDPLREFLTEAEWWAWSKPSEMFRQLNSSESPSPRKARLFAVACCRSIWNLLPNQASRTAVEVSERFADGEARPAERAAAEREAQEALGDRGGPEGWRMYAAYAAWHTSMRDAWEAAWSATQEVALAAAYYSQRESERGFDDRRQEAVSEKERAHCELLRDIFGPLPYRLVALDGGVKTETVRRLARSAYDERDFSDGRMGVLADALEEAGMTDAEVLEHCRRGRAHARGCWVVDLLLDKS
jgi:hypothetical protein